MPTATLTSKGRMTIPAEVRQRLGLKAGDRIEFAYQPDGNVALKTKKIPVQQLRGMIKTKRRKPLTLREIDEAIGDAVAERYLRAVRRRRTVKRAIS